jgi:dihydroorotase
MLIIKNIQKLDGSVGDVSLQNSAETVIEGKGLTLLPALIDPHVHFRTPGAEHKENWISGAQAALQSGVTTVFDMPNNQPGCTTFEAIIKKHELIRSQLDQAGIPLSYHLYFGADRKHLKEIPKIRDLAIGIKVFMGSSTGDLLIDDDATLQEIFKIAADLDMIVSVHAEDESTVRSNKQKMDGQNAPSCHSQVRSKEAARIAVNKALELSAKYQTRLCILHVSSSDEIELIKKAKASNVPVFAEVAPHHLFFSTKAYEKWGTKVQVNPPLREEEDQAMLWSALNEGIIDFIGTDHAPHTLEEKMQGYGKAPSGIPSIELLLPLLLNAVNQGKLSLSTLVNVTRKNIEAIFRLKSNSDLVLVDLKRSKEVKDPHLKTRCGWSPYAGEHLTGWPVYTILQENLYFLNA